MLPLLENSVADKYNANFDVFTWGKNAIMVWIDGFDNFLISITMYFKNNEQIPTFKFFVRKIIKSLPGSGTASEEGNLEYFLH